MNKSFKLPTGRPFLNRRRNFRTLNFFYVIVIVIFLISLLPSLSASFWDTSRIDITKTGHVKQHTKFR